jgi:hypothetical protein
MDTMTTTTNTTTAPTSAAHAKALAMGATYRNGAYYRGDRGATPVYIWISDSATGAVKAMRRMR